MTLDQGGHAEKPHDTNGMIKGINRGGGREAGGVKKGKCHGSRTHQGASGRGNGRHHGSEGRVQNSNWVYERCLWERRVRGLVDSDNPRRRGAVRARDRGRGRPRSGGRPGESGGGVKTWSFKRGW
jgi:hypothetical protein